MAIIVGASAIVMAIAAAPFWLLIVALFAITNLARLTWKLCDRRNDTMTIVPLLAINATILLLVGISTITSISAM
ncbi:hypothetical protein DZF95_00270 [Clavibacter michiganensis]|nr:hypothetical protein DZF95_00270 [Clavibacter michiganensis]